MGCLVALLKNDSTYTTIIPIPVLSMMARVTSNMSFLRCSYLLLFHSPRSQMEQFPLLLLPLSVSLRISNYDVPTTHPGMEWKLLFYSIFQVCQQEYLPFVFVIYIVVE